MDVISNSFYRNVKLHLSQHEHCCMLCRHLGNCDGRYGVPTPCRTACPFSFHTDLGLSSVCITVCVYLMKLMSLSMFMVNHLLYSEMSHAPCGTNWGTYSFLVLTFFWIKTVEKYSGSLRLMILYDVNHVSWCMSVNCQNSKIFTLRTEMSEICLPHILIILHHLHLAAPCTSFWMENLSVDLADVGSSALSLPQ